MSAEEKGELISLLENLRKFVEKLDGVERYVAVLEGFPVVFSGYNEEEAESAAAMAVDVMNASSSFTVTGQAVTPFKEILAVMDENRVIDIAKVRDAILLLEGKREPVETAMSVSLRYVEGRAFHCPWCGRELSLEVYKCPKCGAVVPFMSDRCPHCGADLSIKECPSCGKLINVKSGKKVIKKIIKNKNFIFSESGLGGLIAGLLVYMFTENPLAAVIGGVIGGGLTWYFAEKSTPVREEVEEID